MDGIIFKGRSGEVIRIDKGLIVHGDYFSLCREMAKELERLRAPVVIRDWSERRDIEEPGDEGINYRESR